MPATAGRVRMPANNRVHSSAALQTHGIWQSAIGYDPYAPTADKDSSSKAKSAAKPVEGGSSDEGGENAYASFQGLLALARITTGSNADDTRGSCKKCGRVGHLTFQCRNFLSVKDEKEKDEVAAMQAANAVFDKIKKVNGMRRGAESSEEEEESESSDSDVDSEMERIIAERYGKKFKKKRKEGDSEEKKEEGRRRGRSKKRSSKRSSWSSDDGDDEFMKKEKKRRKHDESSDDDEEDSGGRHHHHRHRKSRKEKKRRRSHRRRDGSSDDGSEEENGRHRHHRHHRNRSSKKRHVSDSESDSTGDSDHGRKRHRRKERRNDHGESDEENAHAGRGKRRSEKKSGSCRREEEI